MENGCGRCAIAQCKVGSDKNRFDKRKAEQFGRQRRWLGAFHIRKIDAFAGIKELVSYKLHRFRVRRHFCIDAYHRAACFNHIKSIVAYCEIRNTKVTIIFSESLRMTERQITRPPFDPGSASTAPD